MPGIKALPGCLLQEIVLTFTHLTDISYPFDYCFTDHVIINLTRTEAYSASLVAGIWVGVGCKHSLLPVVLAKISGMLSWTVLKLPNTFAPTVLTQVTLYLSGS